MSQSERIEEVRCNSDNLSLAGTIMVPEHTETPPGVLFIHGAAENGIGRVSYKAWQLLLLKEGFSSFAFDVRGVGDSEPEGGFYLSTLANRLMDSESALEYFVASGGVNPQRMVAVGNSMGGHIAARLVGNHPDMFRAIILKNSAAYSEESEDKLMKKPGEQASEFTTAVRKLGNWWESPAFEALKRFKGAGMIIESDMEEVIVAGVPHMYRKAIHGPKRNILLRSVGHLYMNRKGKIPEQAEARMYRSSIRFLQQFL